MAKTYHVNLGVRLGNAVVATMLRAGVPMGRFTLLTVRGRKTGLPRTVPVVMGEREGQRWLVSAFGEVNWARNLRAARKATLTRGRQKEEVRAIELAPREAAILLKESLASAPGFIRAYFDVTPDDSLEAFVEEAPRHPVFRVIPITGDELGQLA